MNFKIAAVLLATVWNCQCITIVDRGNPARFSRGAELDDDEVVVVGSTLQNEGHAKDFSVSQQQVHIESGRLMDDVVDNLAAFTEAMTSSMLIEAKDISPGAAVNMCRFARSRVSASRIVNTFESLRVQTATAGVSEINQDQDIMSSNIMTEILRTGIASAASDFLRMEQDLHQFDRTKLGGAPLLHFARAMKSFAALQIALSSLRGVFR